MSSNRLTPTDDPNEGMDAGGEALVDPRVPRVDSKPGIQKSEGQLTILYTIASIVLSFVGFKYSPDKIETAWGAIQTLIYVVGPMLLNVPILKNYINSRGIVTSNTVWANAGLQNPLVSKDGTASALMAHGLMQQGLMGGIGIDSILKTLGGGSGKKDPKTYIGLAKVLGQLVPGGAVVEKVLDKTGVGGFGDETQQGGAAVTNIDPEEIKQAFELVVGNIQTLQRVAVTMWNGGFPGVKVASFDEIVTQLDRVKLQGSAREVVRPVPTQQPQPPPTAPPPTPLPAQPQVNAQASSTLPTQQQGIFPPATHSDK